MLVWEKAKQYFKSHYLAIIFAILVGFIYIAPNLFFIISLGAGYQGIPMMQTANEDFYLARIQEIIDGHPLVGSAAFWEYKDQPPMSPSGGEFFYALPSKLFGISPVNILVISRFFFPAVLFLLIYHLIRRLTGNHNFLTKINAIAGGLFALLGYDLIDYKTIWNFFAGGAVLPGNFLLWSRPVNPIIGGLLLFSFLLCLVAIIQRSKYIKTSIAGAAVCLALMFENYFFSWGIALSVWFVLLAIYFIKKEFQLTKRLAIAVFGGFILSAPYWYMSWQASHNAMYQEVVLRSGLFLTHYPLLNKLMLAVLVVYVFFVGLPIVGRLRLVGGWKESLVLGLKKIADWQWICLAFIIGSLVSYSQQIITGRTIWPYHFVQYTIPLAIVVLMVLFCNVIGASWPKIWRLGMFVLVGVFLIWGSFNQINVYGRYYDYYKGMQSYQPAFDWLNKQEKDCVVLVGNDFKSGYPLFGLIPAFTHCNVYDSSSVALLMPQERIYHNYLTHLRLQGVNGESIEEYLKNDNGEYRGYLFSNWKGLFKGVKDFPDFTDRLLEERLKNVPEDYRRFFSKDFRSELNKYRLDYILSVAPINEKVGEQLAGIKMVYSSNNIYIYDFNN
ncbi:MAG TPA: hypothetical protein P5089_03750 [Candidatus Portnoybacteria bacterium]|nr:hypothetical protein [Candidatus Portnoybacteria bacterium]